MLFSYQYFKNRPSERYMTGLMPFLKDISAFRAPPTPAQFNEESFLATLEISGPHLTSTIKGENFKISLKILEF
jgi:hypothetical protein